MEMTKENAVPAMTVAAVTGQQICNLKSSIANADAAGNDKFVCCEAACETAGVDGNTGVDPCGMNSDPDRRQSSLHEISMTELYDRVYAPRTPVIDSLLYPGLYLFVGAPKVGKSFFMAQLAYHVAAGIPLWDYPVRQGTVLYLALEDDYARLQKRLSRMFDVAGNDNLHLATEANCVADGLDAQLDQFVKLHPDTVMIIVDTLQRVRDNGGEQQYSYAKDYELINRLKAFADQHAVCVLIVHHTRKMEAEDSFDMISGTNGLLGAADGAFVLKKKKRTDRSATLSLVGRDQQDQELKLEFDQEKCFWKFISAETEVWKDPPDPVLEVVVKVIPEGETSWKGTATELLEKVKEMDAIFPLAANALGRKLNVSAGRLFNEYGIRFESVRTRDGRIISLTKVEQNDKQQAADNEKRDA